MDTQKILLDNQSLFSVFSNALLDFLRFIGWWGIRGLSALNAILEKALYTIFGAMDIFTDKRIGLGLNSKAGIYNSLLSVSKALLVIGFIIVGYMLITRRLENKSKLITNILIVMVTIFGMPVILSALVSVTKPATEAFKTNAGFMDSMIIDNVTDLKYLDSQNFSAASIKKKNNFKAMAGDIPITSIIEGEEKIDFKDTVNQDVFKKAAKKMEDGTVELKDVAKKGQFGFSMFDVYRYRYQINWFALYLGGISLMITLLVVSVKTSKSIYSIMYTAIAALFISPLDIASGQRTKKILEEISSLFVVMVFTMLSLYLYVIGLTIAATKVSGFPSILMQLGFSLATISGPNIIQKIFGIDAGVGRELQSAAGAMYMMNTAANGIKGGLRTAGNAVKGVGKAAAKAGEIGAGVAGGAISSFENAKNNIMDKYGHKDPTKGDFSVLGDDNTPYAKDSPQIGTGTGLSTEVNHDAPDSPEPPSAGDDSSINISNNGNNDVDDNAAGISPSEPPPEPVSPAGFTGNKTEESDKSKTDKDVPSGMQDKNGTPDSKRITRDDTLGSAIKKSVSNSKASKGAQSYADRLDTAFNIGKNTVDKAWDDYRKQEPLTPYMQAEPVNMSSNNATKDKAKPDDIIIEPDLSHTSRDTKNTELDGINGAAQRPQIKPMETDGDDSGK